MLGGVVAGESIFLPPMKASGSSKGSFGVVSYPGARAAEFSRLDDFRSVWRFRGIGYGEGWGADRMSALS